eukprot:6791748-Prymnesium_polylepis.2
MPGGVRWLWGAYHCGVHSHNSQPFPRYRVPRETRRLRKYLGTFSMVDFLNEARVRALSDGVRVDSPLVGPGVPA